jgi:pyruvate/2-oxoglutarate dehydrogenase complex dihydrolipoamide acyltransferase (E2) component
MCLTSLRHISYYDYWIIVLACQGDRISPGETLFEVQTDKAVLAFDTEEEGVLAKIIVGHFKSLIRFVFLYLFFVCCWLVIKKGDAQTIPVGTLVGVIVTQGEDWKSLQIDETLVGPVITKNESQKNEKNSIIQHEPIRRQVNILGPVAKSLISLYEIDITKITGSGPHGLVLKRFFEVYFS